MNNLKEQAGTDEFRYLFTEGISEAVRKKLFEWAPDPFQSKSWGLHWRPKQFHLLTCQGNRPIANIGLVHEQVRVGSEQISVVGLGDVITIPEFQRRGLAEKGLVKALEIAAQEWKVRHALIFCFPHRLAFYERQGWELRSEPIWVFQPESRIKMPNHSLVKSWDGGCWPPGEISIDGLPW